MLPIFVINYSELYLVLRFKQVFQISYGLPQVLLGFIKFLIWFYLVLPSYRILFTLIVCLALWGLDFKKFPCILGFTFVSITLIYQISIVLLGFN